MHIIHTNTIEEIAIQDSDENVWKSDPLKQVVEEQIECL